MELGAKIQLKTAIRKGGASTLSRSGVGNRNLQTRKQEVAKHQKTTSTAGSQKEGGILSRSLGDGKTEHKADSGLTVTAGPESQDIALPSGEKLKRTADGVTVAGGEAKEASVSLSEAGTELISFRDKKGSLVEVEPETMSYRVTNKEGNLEQVFHPDGHQEVVARGNYRNPETGETKKYENWAVFGPEGEMVESKGFTGLNIKAGRLSFGIEGGGSSERTLNRPINGQPESQVEEKTTVEKPPANTNGGAPTALLADTSVLSPVNQTSSVESANSVDTKPAQLSPKQRKAAGAVVDGFATGGLGTSSTKTLLSELGVRANQATGKDFNPELKGEEGKSQLQDWRMGQMAELLGQRRYEEAVEVAAGQHDRLAGRKISEQLQSDHLHGVSFDRQKGDAGWEVKGPGRRASHLFHPDRLEGRTVAFREADAKGQITEYQGVLQPKGEGLATFTLQGSEKEFNANTFKSMAVAPEDHKPAGAPTAKPEPRIESDTPIGPTPEKPSREKLADALINGVQNLQGRSSEALLEGFGVQPNQKSGSDFQPELKGEQMALQTKEWELGQSLSLIKKGETGFAKDLVKRNGTDVKPGGDALEAFSKERDASQAFNDGYQDRGWSVKAKRHQQQKSSVDFWPSNLEGRDVAFRAPNSSGEMVEYKGKLVPDRSRPDSSLFTLEGDKPGPDGKQKQFNANTLDDFAVAPPRKDHSGEVKSFKDSYREAGWEISGEKKTTRAKENFTSSELHGREVAFLQADDKGQLQEHRGIVQHQGKGFSSEFKLEGQEGVFNSNHFQDFAVAPEKKGGGELPKAQPFTPSSVGDPNYTPKKGEPKMQILANKGDSRVGLDFNGVTNTTESGVKVSESLLGPKTITLPNGVKVRRNKIGNTDFKVAGDSAKSVEMKKRPDGLEYLEIKAKDGKDIFLDPKSLTYEVRDTKTGDSTVFHPNQLVTKHSEGGEAGSTTKAPEVKPTPAETPQVKSPELREKPVETSQVKAPEVKPTPAETPQVKSPELREKPVETPQVKAPEVKPTPAETPQVKAPEVKSTPAETPQVKSPELKEKPVDAPPIETGSEAKTIPDPNPEVKGFPELTDIKSDFFAGADNPDVQIFETQSGLFMRAEGNTRAFKLPNGDAFRTDSAKVEVLGDKPTAKNARMVQDGDKLLLAYSDKDGNRWQVDADNGDISVSNRQGTLTQNLNADGSESFEVRGTYTTESGAPKQYFKKASFGRDGEVKKLEGFEDIQVKGDQLNFTLPNGQETNRTLITDTKIQANVAKRSEASGGVAEEWGGALNLADDLLAGPTSQPKTEQPTVNPANNAGTQAGETSNVHQTTEMPEPPPGATTPSGMSRVNLPGGGTMTRMPNGMTVYDTDKPYAVDTEGNRFDVKKTPYQSNSGAEANLLNFTDTKGRGFTLSDEHLDLMAQSADGKVNQLLAADGTYVTSIRDGERKHTHGMTPGPYPGTHNEIPSPGVFYDRSQPGKLHVQGIPNGGYDLPLDLPQPPGYGPQQTGDPSMNGSYRPQPGQIHQGVKPSMWQRFKSVFTGENPWANQGTPPPHQGPHGYSGHQAGMHHQGPPPYVGGNYHCGHGQYDPQLEGIRQMTRASNTMLAVNMGVTALHSISTMFWLF